MQKKIKNYKIAIIAATVLGSFFLWQSLARKEPMSSMSGYVERREAQLSFLVPGKIQQLFVDEGQVVRKGMTLASLDARQYYERYQQLEANSRQAQIQCDYLAKEYQRQRFLLETQANSQHDFDAVSAQYQQAEAQLESALSLVRQAEYDCNQTTLIAPVDGVMTRRIQEIGSVVNPGTPVFTICVTDPVWVRAYATLAQLNQMSPGTPVKVRTDMGHEYHGVVGYISPQAEFTPKTVQTDELRPLLVYRFRVTVTNPDDALRQGLPVKIFPIDVS